MVEQGFFSYLTQTRDFQRFESELDKYISTLSHDNETLFLCERIKNILTTMADAPKVYDGAHFNINVIGSRFRDLITNIEIKNNTESVFFMFYRFYQEIKFTLSINDQSVFSISTSNVDEVIDDALEKLSERNKKLITWVRYLMPAYMLDESVKKLPEIQHFNSLFQNLETTKKELDEAYQIKAKQVTELTEKLEKNQTKGTFVLLNQAFEKLRSTKNKEKWWALIPLFLVAIALVLLPFLLIFTHLSPPACNSNET